MSAWHPRILCTCTWEPAGTWTVLGVRCPRPGAGWTLLHLSTHRSDEYPAYQLQATVVTLVNECHPGIEMIPDPKAAKETNFNQSRSNLS